nr:MAG TPA: hypothetical protein [Caudoviricetes sp.]
MIINKLNKYKWIYFNIYFLVNLSIFTSFTL